MSIKTFFTNLIDSLLEGSFERVRVVNQMNMAFREYFIGGNIVRLCKVSISQGCSEYAHEMSSLWFRSGFKVTIENDTSLQMSEMTDLAGCIINNVAFVRQLMSMGFDTLVVKGKSNGMHKNYALKKYANLNNYFIDSHEYSQTTY